MRDRCPHYSGGEFIFLSRSTPYTASRLAGVTCPPSRGGWLTRSLRSNAHGYDVPRDDGVFGCWPPSIAMKVFSEAQHSYGAISCVKGSGGRVLGEARGRGGRAALARFATSSGASCWRPRPRRCAAQDRLPPGRGLGDFDASRRRSRSVPWARSIATQSRGRSEVREYWSSSRPERRQGVVGCFTPYELRLIGTYVRLAGGSGQRAARYFDVPASSGWALAESSAATDRAPRSRTCAHLGRIDFVLP